MCYKCNKPARTSAKFCASCGARLDIGMIKEVKLVKEGGG